MPKYALKNIKWKQIAFGERVTDGHEKILEQFMSGMIKTEKLHSPDGFPRFAFRLNDKDRAICTTIKFKGEDCLVVLDVDHEHKYDKTPGMAKDAASDLDPALMKSFDPKSIKPQSLAEDVSAIETADGKIMVYSREQAEAADSIDHVIAKALSDTEHYIVNGPAGSGKTTIAHYVLSRAKGKAIYLTKSKGLVSATKKAINGTGTQDAADEDGAEEAEAVVQCLTYEQLISRKLFEHFPEFVSKVFADKKHEHYEAIKNAFDLLQNGDVKLQEALMQHHLEQNSTDVASNEDNRVIDLCLKAYLKETLCDKAGFIRWLQTTPNKDTRKLIKSLPESMSLEDAYYEIQKSHMPLGKKSTLYKNFHETIGATNAPSQAKQLLKKYTDYLASNHKIDLAFINAKAEYEVDEEGAEEPEDNVTVLVIDEAQNFSPMEIETALQNIRGKKIVYLCRDGNQSMEDPFDLIPHTMLNITGKEPLKIFDLNTSYRTPPAVTELVNILLNIKGQVIGGKLHKVDSTAADTSSKDEEKFTSKSDNNGTIKWIQNIKDKSITDLKEVSTNIVSSIVVIFSEKDRESAEKLFPDAMILTPAKIVGLEFENVILYNPFGDNSLLGRSDELFRSKYKASAKAPTNYPKDDKCFKYVKPFNELFVAMTRTTANLYVLDLDANISSSKKASEGNFFLQAFEAVLAEHQSEVVTKTEKLSLRELVSFIDGMKDTFQESVLVKYIAEAVKKIQDDKTSSDTELYVLLSSLKTSINGKNETLSQTISAELEKRAPKKVELAQTSSGSSSPTLDTKKTTKSSSPHTKKAEASSVMSEKEKLKIVDEIEKALHNEDIINLKIIINKNPECVEFRNRGGFMPLHMAAAVSNREALEALLQAGADPNATETKNGITPLYNAAANGNKDAINVLLEWGANVNTISDGNTPLHIAVVCNKPKSVELLLKAGANTITPDKNGLTPLALAKQKGYQKIAGIISSSATHHPAHKPPFPNTQKSKNVSVVPKLTQHSISEKELCTLIQNKQYAKLQEAIDNNPNCVRFKEFADSNPMHYAAMMDKVEAIGMLLKAGVDINIADKNGETPLHFAVTKNKVCTVQFLLDHGADKNKFNIFPGNTPGNSPLHEAVNHNAKESLEALLNAGADVSAKNGAGKTALDLATEKGLKWMMKILSSAAAQAQESEHTQSSHAASQKELDASILSEDEKQQIAKAIKAQSNMQRLKALVKAIPGCLNFIDSGFTGLHYATMLNDQECVKVLVEAGADVTSLYNGLTPLDIARQHNYPEIRAILSDAAQAKQYKQKPHSYTKLEGKGDSVILSESEKVQIAIVLQTIIRENDLSCLKALIKAIPECENFTDQNQLTALHLATLENKFEVIKVLVEAGADVNAMANGDTALHMAARHCYSNIEVVKFLLNVGADVNAISTITEIHCTPLDLARENGNPEIIGILSDAIAAQQSQSKPSSHADPQKAAQALAKQKGDPTIIQMFSGHGIGYAAGEGEEHAPAAKAYPEEMACMGQQNFEAETTESL